MLKVSAANAQEATVMTAGGVVQQRRSLAGGGLLKSGIKGLLEAAKARRVRARARVGGGGRVRGRGRGRVRVRVRATARVREPAHLAQQCDDDALGTLSVVSSK